MPANLRRQQQVLSILDRVGEAPAAEDHEGLSFWAVRPDTAAAGPILLDAKRPREAGSCSARLR